MAKKLEFFYDCSSPWTYLAFSKIEEVAARHNAELVWRPILVGGVFNARAIDRVRIVFQFFQLLQQRMWNFCAAHADKSLGLRDIQYRHQPGDDRRLDAHFFSRLTKAIEIRIVKKQLRDNEISTQINLLFEMLHIARAIEALRMTFGITGDADRKIMTPAREFHQISCVGKAALGGGELRLTDRWIAAQCKDILHTRVPQAIKNFTQLRRGMPHAGEMGHRANADLFLDAFDQIDGLLPSAAASTISHRYIAGRQRFELIDRLIQLSESRFRFRWKKFKRQRWQTFGK